MRRWTWIVFALGCVGCAGDELSVGELRCAGEGVRCKAPQPVSSGEQRGVVTSRLEETQGTLQWEADVPCPGVGHGCDELQQSLIVHADDSVTIAVVRLLSGPGLPVPQRDVWIAHFDAGGTMLWQNELFASDWTAPVGDLGGFSAALARDTDDAALLAVDRQKGAGYELSLYRMSDAGEPRRLFSAEGIYTLSSVAIDREDVLVSGYYWTKSPADAPNPELSRYGRDGTLVWRQDALCWRTGQQARLKLDIGASAVATPMPLAVDSHGRAAVVVPTSEGGGVVVVERDGNVRWSSPFNSFVHRADDAPLPTLLVDSQNRPLIASNSGGALSGVSTCVLDRFDAQGDPPSRLVTLEATRDREEYWDPVMLGMTPDAQDRVLVATVTGAREKPRLVIDRYSEDLALRESFVVPDVWSEIVDGTRTVTSDFTQIRIGADGGVYVASRHHLARMDLSGRADATGSEADAGASDP